MLTTPSNAMGKQRSWRERVRPRPALPPPAAQLAAALLLACLLLPAPAAAQTCNAPNHIVTSSDASCASYCNGLAERAGTTANPETYRGGCGVAATRALFLQQWPERL